VRGWMVLTVLALATGSVFGFASDVSPSSSSEAVLAFLPDPTWRVEVDGAEVRTAETYFGDPYLLVLGCSLRFPVVVCRADQTIRYIPQENVVRDAEGNVSMKGTPTDPISSYQATGGQIIFKAEGRKVRLSPRAPLVGPQTLERIIAHNPDYESRIKNYKPNETAVAFLSKYTRKTDIQIYFGSWCGHCEAWVPRLVKSLQAANNQALQTEFQALPKGFFTDQMVRAKGITGVPTIILLQEGKEIGRLNGAPQSGTVEEALAKVLQTIAP